MTVEVGCLIVLALLAGVCRDLGDASTKEHSLKCLMAHIVIPRIRVCVCVCVLCVGVLCCVVLHCVVLHCVVDVCMVCVCARLHVRVCVCLHVHV